MSTPTSSPGRAIGGRYRLDASVGRGGMGTVWEAYDEVLRRRVAVKEVLLPPGIPAEERAMLCERTLREARSAARLTHPSVVVIYDVVEEDDRPWIVMELLNARSLADLIREHGPLPAEQVASVGLQVLAALESAHDAEILHRDVKPGNVLLAPDGRATLTDFGVARASGDSALTSTGLLLGSPSYISPERARGGDPTPASDLWALGATLYAAVEGQAPFERGDPLPTLTAVVGEPPDPMRLAGPLEPVLAGLLAKDVGYRWDAERARSGLRAALGGAGPTGPTTSSVPPATSSAPPYPASAPPFSGPSSSAPPYASTAPPYASTAPPYASTAPPYAFTAPPYASSAPPAAAPPAAGSVPRDAQPAKDVRPGEAAPGAPGRGGWPDPATGPAQTVWPPAPDDSSGGVDVGLAALFGHGDSERTGAGSAAAATATFSSIQPEQAAASGATAYQRREPGSQQNQPGYQEQQPAQQQPGGTDPPASGGWPHPGAGTPPGPDAVPVTYGPPAPQPAAYPPPATSRRPLLIALIVLGLVVVIVGAVLLGTGLSTGRNKGGGGPLTPVSKATATPAPSASSSRSSSSSSSSSATTVLTPYASTDGYRVSVPDGWSATGQGNGVTDFNDPQGGRFLRYGASTAATDAVTTLTQGEQTFKNSGSIHDYQRIRLGRAQVLGRDGAVWEFRFTTAAGERRRARYETFVDNGVDYELYSSTVDHQWSPSQALFARSLKTFTVTG